MDCGAGVQAHGGGEMIRDPTQPTKGPDEKYCYECGAIIRAKAEICPKCGVRQPHALTMGTRSGIVLGTVLAVAMVGVVWMYGVSHYKQGPVANKAPAAAQPPRPASVAHPSAAPRAAAQPPRPAPPTVPGAVDPVAQMLRAATVKVVSKGFEKADYQTVMHDGITVRFVIKNTSGKDIRGLRGTMVFKDIFGAEIKSFQLSYYEGLNAGEQKTWDGVVEYNSFVAEDQKLRDTPLGNLKVEWKPRVVLFADGTKLGQ